MIKTMKNLSEKINTIHRKTSLGKTTPEFSFSSFKESLKGQDIAQLQQIAGKLELICTDFDPFVPVLSDELLPLINEFNLVEVTKNPFEFTNTLLRIMTMVEEETKTKLH